MGIESHKGCAREGKREREEEIFNSYGQDG